MIKEKLEKIIKNALKEAESTGDLKFDEPLQILIERPREKVHGDISTSVAFSLSEKIKKSPQEIADIICKHLKPQAGFIEKIEIAGGGFINFFINRKYLCKSIIEIIKKGNKFGCSNIGGGRKIHVEFASVGPTGPIHIGHARGAVFGDVLANILKEVGYKVTREYYINDVGTQIEILGKSLMVHYMEMCGVKTEAPVDGYEGQYILDLAAKIKKKYKENWISKDVSFFSSFAVREILTGIKKDLKDFGVIFDNWVSERELYRKGEVKNTIEILKKKGYTILEDGALWFSFQGLNKDTDRDKDNVLIRSTGIPTYFASDIAYHRNKYRRGFDEIIDIWGQDHHGHVSRLKNAVEAIGYNSQRLEIILYQLVSLSRSGTPIKMSTRKGEFITLREVMNEVGKDSIRFFFLMRKSSSHLNFDLDLAKAQSLENPVYYVQYAHARICSIFREAEKKLKIKSLKSRLKYEIPPFKKSALKIENLELLKEEVEVDLIKKLVSFPDEIAQMARIREPQGLTVYLQEIATLFHRFYTDYRVISDNLNLTNARLALIKAIQIILAKGLRLLGIEPNKRM